jgi:hypothetical protein
MQYVLLIYEDERVYGNKVDDPALLEIVGRHRAFAQGLGPAMRGGAGLKSSATATTVRTTGGAQAIHDGPFAEAKEQLGGFYIVEAADLDAAIEIGKRVPLGRDGAIEIRPLLTQDDEDGA